MYPNVCASCSVNLQEHNRGTCDCTLKILQRLQMGCYLFAATRFTPLDYQVAATHASFYDLKYAILGSQLTTLIETKALHVCTQKVQLLQKPVLETVSLRGCCL